MVATTVSSKGELEQIFRLQQLNLRTSLQEDEIQTQGFVTLVYPVETLEQIHFLSPSVIIKDGDKVAGYALVVTPDGRYLLPPLGSMFNKLETLSYNGRPVCAYKFYVMGQVCIDKPYRGMGLFEMLYDKHKELFQDHYDIVITDISTMNQRSVRAHERIGFKPIHVYRDELDEWAVVVWDWK
jgi:hypothetical protein